MSIAQHNWKHWAHGARVKCWGGPSRWDRGCHGCGAEISQVQAMHWMTVFFVQGKHGEPVLNVHGLDNLWHQKYRPMAEFAGLVEEAGDQA